MPGLDRMLNAVTGDYVDAAGGEYLETRTAAPAVYHQLKGELGRWWGDPLRGSKLYLVKTMGISQDTVVFTQNAALGALQRLVDAGLVVSPEAVAEGTAKSRMLVETRCVDIQTGEAVLLTPIGGK